MLPDLGLLWTAIEDDVKRRSSWAHEFPLTTMTGAVAEAIWRLPSTHERAARRALDVGTGTGVHALIMSALGFDVDAIDISAEAIRFANARARRLENDVREARGADVLQVRFYVAGVDDWTADPRYDLITFNPPAYYHPLGPVVDTPAARGVFVDDENHLDPRGALLYRLFERLVRPLLAPNGHLICSWPGLERRVVESSRGDAPRNIVTAAEQLETWCGVTVVGDRDPKTFFCYPARVNSDDYGLHEPFWRNLIAARDRGMYSALAHAERAEQHSLEFGFGVLHLIRDSDDDDLFRQVLEPARQMREALRSRGIENLTK